MGFLSFVVLVTIAYLIWRISDQLPDIVFRLSEIQRDIAELRRRSEPQEPPAPQPTSSAADEESSDE